MCPFRLAIQMKFRRTLASHLLEQRTCPVLQREIIAGVKALHDGTHFQSTLPASRSQSKIGWVNMFRGVLSNRWARHQRLYMGSLRDPPDMTKKPDWAVSLIVVFLHHTHEMWLDRCTTVHEKTVQHETKQQRNKAEAMTRTLYKHANNVAAHD